MTKRLSFPACLIALSLSACSNWGYNKGIGFTGIDGEPKSVAQASGQSGVVTRALSPLEALAALPPISVRADTASQADLAGAAIAAGGDTPQTGVWVHMHDQPLLMSMVRVNGQMFSVLKVPEGNTSRMVEGTANAFVGSAPELTGCLTQSGAYARGGSEARPKGVAVAMNCS